MVSYVPCQQQCTKTWPALDSLNVSIPSKLAVVHRGRLKLVEFVVIFTLENDIANRNWHVIIGHDHQLSCRIFYTSIGSKGHNETFYL